MLFFQSTWQCILKMEVIFSPKLSTKLFLDNEKSSSDITDPALDKELWQESFLWAFRFGVDGVL